MSLSRRAAGAAKATTLRHNPLNAVTATVERITDAEGHTLIRKVLQQPTVAEGPWMASRSRPSPQHRTLTGGRLMTGRRQREDLDDDGETAREYWCLDG